MRKWSKDLIAAEIRRLYRAGVDLNYTAVAKEQVALLRAATRYFGSWRGAVEYAGLDYEEIRRYRIWDRERIVQRIRELHAQGADLSWRHVSTQLDPQLAAAATRWQHFGSWSNAIAAAGLDYQKIRRYRAWDGPQITRELQALHAQGVDLSARSMERRDLALITAARRRFDSWERALAVAGLDYQHIALRVPRRRRSRGRKGAPEGPGVDRDAMDLP